MKSLKRGADILPSGDFYEVTLELYCQIKLVEGIVQDRGGWLLVGAKGKFFRFAICHRLLERTSSQPPVKHAVDAHGLDWQVALVIAERA